MPDEEWRAALAEYIFELYHPRADPYEGLTPCGPDETEEDFRARRRRELHLRHPSPTPDINSYEAPKTFGYRLGNPGRFHSSAIWRQYCKDLDDGAERHPGDETFPAYKRTAELVLAWREKIRPEDRYWRPDGYVYPRQAIVSNPGKREDRECPPDSSQEMGPPPRK